MYKDKPYNYGITSSHRRGWRRKRVIVGGILFILGALYWLELLPHRESKILLGTENSSGWNWLKTTKATDWDGRREEVKAAFVKSWDAYDRHAWGYDEFHPLSGIGHQMTPKGMGWIIVDSLDTLILMNLTSQLSHAREWIATSLDYDQNQEVNTFETTIRMLGGFLSAHYLSTTFPDMAPIADDDRGTKGEDLYIEKATDLAERLLGAYETKSGIPLASVNLQTMKGIPSTADAGASSTAEAASLQLEMKYLAKLTGEKNYWDKAEKVIEAIDANHAEDGLVPIFIYADAGTFRGENIRLGSRGDSYYEYLIKQYLQTNCQEPIYEEMWDQALAGVRKHLLTYSSPSNMLVLGERPNGLDKELSPKMDHLVCFMPGTIALAATGGSTVREARASGKWGTKQEKDMVLARELMKTCWGMYKFTATGLAPEIAHFNMYDPPHMAEDPAYATVTPPAELGDEEDASWRQDYIIKPADTHNLQRPETVESLFYMYRITGDEMYREWGWEMFQSFMKYSAVENDGGFTSLADVTRIPPPTRDNMESFWLVRYPFFFIYHPFSLLLNRKEPQADERLGTG